jgi:hypothetical protein
MGFIRNLLIRLLKLQPAREKEIIIREPMGFQANVLKNQILYRGDPVEIEQFFKAVANTDVAKARFWAATPESKVRKTHSGIVQVVIDRYADIILEDMDNVDFGEVGEVTPIKDRWDNIAKENDFDTLMNEALTSVLAGGDGAFKISLAEDIDTPIIEFFTADNVEFIRKRNRLHEIHYFTSYFAENKEYRLKEIYGKGYVKYELYDDKGKSVPLTILEETRNLVDATFNGHFIMGVPFIVFSSSKWKGRGKALFDSKTDAIDCLDEVISQWLDAVRDGRIHKYIPEDFIPRNPETGELFTPNDFDHRFTKVSMPMSENQDQKIDVVQPTINYEAYINSYSNFLDMCLQGIISPSTLGIDLKKTDNASSQREKEKITMHVRSKIVDVMCVVVPILAETTLKVEDLMTKETSDEYEASVKFGEYGAPGFDAVVETVGQAKSYGIMSTEKCVDEMYGDTMTDEEKAEEVARIKEENSISVEPTLVEDDIVDEPIGGDE